MRIFFVNVEFLHGCKMQQDTMRTTKYAHLFFVIIFLDAQTSGSRNAAQMPVVQICMRIYFVQKYATNICAYFFCKNLHDEKMRIFLECVF